MENNKKNNSEENRLRSTDPHFSSGAGPGNNTSKLKNADGQINDDKKSSPAGEEFKKKHYPGKPNKNGFLDSSNAQ